MDNNERFKLENEIKYWSNLISSHKNSNGSKPSTHYKKEKNNSLSNQYVWNNERHNQTQPGKNYLRFDQSLRASSSVDNFKNHHLSDGSVLRNHGLTSVNTNKKIHKWKKADSFAPQSAKVALVPTVLLSPLKTNASTRSLECDTKPLPPTSLINCSKSNLQFSEKSSKFKWHKSHDVTETTSLSSQLPQGLEEAKDVSRTFTSKYRYRRRKSFEKPFNCVNKSMKIRKLILGKYLRFHNNRSSVNLSKNPYKVVMRPVQLSTIRGRFANHRTLLSDSTMSSFKRIDIEKKRRYKPKKIIPRSKYVHSHFKFVRAKVQTRSKISGNIVLKRKQQQPDQHRHTLATRFSTPQQRLAISVIHRSLETARSKNKHSIKKIYCIFFNRFGKCNRGEKCPYTHDPDRVAVCTRFLRGTCRDDSCPFSHKTSKAKMSLCNFFLRGKCSAKNCPYLHVFHGPDAEVCKNFAKTGYCVKAAECQDLHIKVCPDFYKSGQCEGQCKLPHRRKYTRKRTPSSFLSNSIKSRMEAEKLDNLVAHEESLSASNTTNTEQTITTSNCESQPCLVRIQPRL